jgi:hypothetical protein
VELSPVRLCVGVSHRRHIKFTEHTNFPIGEKSSIARRTLRPAIGGCTPKRHGSAAGSRAGCTSEGGLFQDGMEHGRTCGVHAAGCPPR